MKIGEIFKELNPLLPHMEGFDSYKEDVVLSLSPEAVLRPRNQEELSSILSLCSKNKIPFTICGSQTSVTGASVTDRGVLISMEKLKEILEVRKNEDGTARILVEPGIILSEFQFELEKMGYYYPPDPTSFEEVQLGGTVATNATGENSYHYGSTRNYILALHIIDGKGNARKLLRSADPRLLSKSKNLAGFNLGKEEIDAWIGSEGTLGVITRIEVLALSKPHPFLSLFTFFQNEEDALEFTLLCDENRESLKLRCLEIMDHKATAIMAEKSKRFQFPEDSCTIYIKFENPTEDFMESNLYKLGELYESSVNRESAGLNQFENSLLAADRDELLEFRRLRHHIPATINERAKERRASGGGKVSSDWWIPLSCLKEQFAFLRKKLSELPIEAIAFGHIGNGHPHVNLIPKDAQEKALALQFTKECMERAARNEGGVCGEHGLGKIKTWALQIQWDKEKIDSMREIKKKWDPDWLAAPGNLFTRGDES